jgi:methylenetetrahydrofolate dehydrogenase (NADP+)/methenyltetrahydrofolate cyclohydrolase
VTPPTAAAIVEIIDSLNLSFVGMSILVIGQGELVGKPITKMLTSKGLKPQIADKNTSNLPELLLSADIVISGTGQAGLITGAMIKPGAVIIDAGTAESNGGIVGDVDFASVKDKASFISPVPGGVGPVTVAKLLANVVKVAQTKK